MVESTILGLLIPFAGTSLGAACVFFLKKDMSEKLRKCLLGFAAGIMVAASIWSLIIPAIEQSSSMGDLAFVPSIIGFWAGILFLLAIDAITPHLHIDSKSPEGVKSKLKNTTMLFLAVTIHNIPEGMAAGVVFAAWISGEETISLAAALTLSIGLAIQNFPEGAIVSGSMLTEETSKGKAFGFGVLSGVVEPVAAGLTILASTIVKSALPYLLSFAAGAMIYVVVEELVPDMSKGKHSNLGTISFALGFTLMMALDIALG